MFPVLDVPGAALQLLFTMYTFRDKINMSLVCAQAKRVLRQNIFPNMVVHLKVAIKFDSLNHYVEFDVSNEQRESMGRWTVYKMAEDIATEEIIGETYVKIDLAHHSFTDRKSPLTNIQTFHIMKTALSFLDHMQFIFPRMSVDILLVLNSLEMEDRSSFNALITRAHTIELNKCEIPEDESAYLHEIFQQHHRIVIRDSELVFSEDIYVEQIEFQSMHEFTFSKKIYAKKIVFDGFGLETHVAKNFHLFQCQEFVFDGEFGKEEIGDMLRSWKAGKNPQLKMMKLMYVLDQDEIIASLKAKKWDVPGPRIFKLGNFEQDCVTGHDIRRRNKSLGTLNFLDDEKFTFVVWE